MAGRQTNRLDSKVDTDCHDVFAHELRSKICGWGGGGSWLRLRALVNISPLPTWRRGRARSTLLTRPSQNLLMRQLFPTPESPMLMSLMRSVLPLLPTVASDMVACAGGAREALAAIALSALPGHSCFHQHTCSAVGHGEWEVVGSQWFSSFASSAAGSMHYLPRHCVGGERPWQLAKVRICAQWRGCVSSVCRGAHASMSARRNLHSSLAILPRL